MVIESYFIQKMHHYHSKNLLWSSSSLHKKKSSEPISMQLWNCLLLCGNKNVIPSIFYVFYILEQFYAYTWYYVLFMPKNRVILDRKPFEIPGHLYCKRGNQFCCCPFCTSIYISWTGQVHMVNQVAGQDSNLDKLGSKQGTF